MSRAIRLCSFVPSVVLASSAMLVVCPPARAQTTQLTGVVRDATGAVIPRASVQITRQDTGTAITLTTNAAGAYTASSLRPAAYNVEATAAGFSQAKARAQLRTGEVLQLDLQLSPAGAAETVEVRDSGLLQKESGAVDTEVDRNFAANLPLNGRSFSNLLLLTPGTVETANGYSVNGQRENQNQFNVDGVSANFGAYSTATLSGSAAGAYAPLSSTGGTNTLLSTDALQEFQVQTSTYAAE